MRSRTWSLTIPLAALAMRRASALAVRLMATLAVLAGALLAGAARADELDRGGFRIYLHDREMGRETFVIEQYADSIIVESSVGMLVRTPSGEDSLIKSMHLHIDPFDLNLRDYSSAQALRGTKVNRRLEMSDTSFSSFRDEDGRGQMDVLVRPPGRIYIHDPDLYVLFDLVTRNLHGQTFDTRPIQLMVLSYRDTTLEIQATKKGTAPLRWGSRTVQANKLELSDGVNQLLLWSDTRGRLLVFENAASGLRVVRDAPAAKAAPAKKSAPVRKPTAPAKG